MGLKNHIKLYEEFYIITEGHPGFFTTREETEAWLKEMGVEGYTINEDLIVDVEGDVDLTYKNPKLEPNGPELEYLPVQFGKVRGDFRCNDNNLKSLKGSPSRVKGSFWCADNKLIDLKGGPEYIGGSFECNTNEIGSLEHGPKTVIGTYECSENKLKNLHGAPIVILKGHFYCEHNELETLEGAPRQVGKSFKCSYNKLENLVGGPLSVGGYYCNNNQLNTLKGAPESVKGAFNCTDNNLTDLKGAPVKIGKHFEFLGNDIEDLLCEIEYIGGTCLGQTNPIQIPYAPFEIKGDAMCDSGVILSDWFEAVRQNGISWDTAQKQVEENEEMRVHLYEKYGGEEKFWNIFKGYKMASHEDDEKLRDIGIWD